MLEVIIGLIFTYLLLSLLATTINELLASWRGWRGHFLEEGLKRILEYKNNPTVYNSFKENALYQQLHNNPKVMGRVSHAPSYMSSDAFVTILFKVLRGEVSAKELIEQLPPDSNIKLIFDELKDDTKDKIEVFKARATQMHAELMAILDEKQNLNASVEGFINTLPPGSKLQDVIWEFWKGSDQKAEVFRIKINTWYEELMEILNGRPNIRNILNQIPKDSQLRKVLDQIYEDCENLEEFKGKVQNWYNELMVRATGWYKKHIQMVTIILGFTIAAAFNADTFSIYERLSTNSSAREDVVNLATNFIEKSDANPSDTAMTAEQLTTRIDGLLKEDIAKVRNPLGLGWHPDNEDYNFQDDGLVDWVVRILGWLVTALAISLGAPFWFDLLRKFVRIRGTGGEPQGNTTKVVIQTGKEKD